MPHESRPGVPAPREHSHGSPDGDDLVVAPSQPRPGLLLVRVLGDLDLRSVGRCARVLHGAVDAAAAEHELRGAHARVVCDVTGVDFVGVSGLGVLMDVDAYARSRGVAFVVDGVTDVEELPDRP